MTQRICIDTNVFYMIKTLRNIDEMLHSFFLNQYWYIAIVLDIVSSLLSGAEEACRAHNPKVVGSKPTLATLLHFCKQLL